MTYWYVIDVPQQKVMDDTLVSDYIGDELRNAAENYLMSDGGYQNGCERHCPQKKKTDNKPYAQKNDSVEENKHQLGEMHFEKSSKMIVYDLIHDAGMGVDDGKSQIWNVLFHHDDC